VSSEGPVATNPTHARILQTAWEHLRNHGEIVSMSEIARACGLSRQAVYLYVGSRAGLLVQMVRHHDDRSGLAGRFERATGLSPATAALEATLRVWFDYVPEILPAARALMAAAYHDADARQAMENRMEAMRFMLRGIVVRLLDEGRLDPSWKIDRAAEALWSLTHFRTYHDLVIGRGWSPGRFIDMKVREAENLLLAPRKSTPKPKRSKF
jgi:AcrR family transcriptional regulator